MRKWLAIGGGCAVAAAIAIVVIRHNDAVALDKREALVIRLNDGGHRADPPRMFALSGSGIEITALYCDRGMLADYASTPWIMVELRDSKAAYLTCAGSGVRVYAPWD